MNYPKDSANRFYERMDRQGRRSLDQDDLSDLYDDGKAIWVSGRGFIPRRRRISFSGSDGQ